MSSNEEYKNLLKEKIDEFKQIISNFGGEENIDYIFRNTADKVGEDNKGAFLGCIDIKQTTQGPYQDLSIVIFPSNKKIEGQNEYYWLVSFAVGSYGLENDYYIASLPGIRRFFNKHLNKLNYTFIKNDFTDFTTKDGIRSYFEENKNKNKGKINKSLENAYHGSLDYTPLLLACSLFNPEIEFNIVEKYLAIYAEYIRQWPSNKEHRDNINRVLENNTNYNQNDEQEKITNLLENRKYLVLQGAPGTGKTRMAKKIAEENKGIIFFTQFHAETTYSDFIYGIMPKTSKTDHLEYELKEGIFVQAIREAQKEKNKDKKVYLIIDEINRANLSNVLGEAFYLFEPNMKDSAVKILVSPGDETREKLELSKLPDNLRVIATMNTADRSLAIVDFALRRRFAWYTMNPHELPGTLENGNIFCKKEFNDISKIFEKYATDEELNLQPGHAYFIVGKKEDIDNRLRYELMPLIKEYLLDGMLSRAKDDFVNYFRERIEEEMFE